MPGVRIAPWLSAGGMLAGAALLSACDEGSASTLPYDPARAGEIAREVLLDPDDLAGKGWEMTGEEFSESSGGGATDPFDFRPEGACVPITDRLAKYESSSVGKRAIEAKRDLARPASGAAVLVTEVSSEVEIYREGADLGDDLPFLRSIIASPEFDGCMEETLARGVEEIAGEGTQASLRATRAEPGAISPQGGAAVAFDLRINVGATSLEMRVEQYFWASENAVLSVQVTGERQDVTHDVVQTAIDSLVRKADKEKALPGD